MCATHARARGRVLGVLTGALLVGTLGTAKAAERDVDWANRMNVTIRGDAVQKTAGCQGCDDAGAISRQTIRGDGYVEFRPGEAGTFFVAGLTHDGAGTKFSDIDFAFRFNGAGTADIVENGAYQSGGDTPYTPGDTFRIAVVNNRVQYFKNGRLLHESARRGNYPLAFDVALGTMGATIQQARIDTDSGAFGQLSRRSYSRGESAGTSGQIVYVTSRDWTNTGIYVYAGDRVTFDAEQPVRLLARIGDSASLTVNGNGALSPAPTSGYLYLGVDPRYRNIASEYRINVMVEPR